MAQPKKAAAAPATAPAVVRPAAGAVRTVAEGGVFATAAVVVADIVSTKFPETAGAGVLAAAVVGAFGAWAASAIRTLRASESNPRWLKILLGVQ